MRGLSLEQPELRALVDATEACMSHCRDMLEYEGEKRKLLLSGDYSKINSVLSAQQSAIMQLDNLETLRLKAQAEAGLEGLSAQEIADRVDDPEQKKALESLFLEWRVLLDRLRQENDAALDIAREDLKMFDLLAHGGPAEDSGVYSRAGRPEAGYRNSFEEKV